MEEVRQLSDRITVFRDGTYVGTGTRDGLSEADVVRMMVGRSIGDIYRHDPRIPGKVVLDVTDLAAEGLGPTSFQVRAGEVVSMSGLIGSGRTELARLIFGADRRRSGTVLVNGKPSNPANPSDAIADGLAMVPEDRKAQGLFLDHSVERNVAITSLDNYVTVEVVRNRAVRQAVLEQMGRLRLRQNAIDLPVRALSGGNQQKAALARWLLRDSAVMILDEPTRGVDIGAKREIYELIDALARAGKAILVISSDLPEAIGIADRVLVVRGGRIVKELPAAEASEEAVMRYAVGASADRQSSNAGDHP
jgi:ribose transport system ATP-binding protein